jgi:hypothetical protein
MAVNSQGGRRAGVDPARQRAHRDRNEERPPFFTSSELGLVHGYMWAERVGFETPGLQAVLGRDIPPELREKTEAGFGEDFIPEEYWERFFYGAIFCSLASGDKTQRTSLT